MHKGLNGGLLRTKSAFNFLVLNQVQLHAELYQGLADMVEHDVWLDPAKVG